MKKNLLVIAGEASGDMHGADVIRELRRNRSDLDIWGLGGERLREEGVETLHDIKELDVLGFVEVLRRYPFFKKVFNEVLAGADRRKPDAALLIDYPGFNLRLASELKKRGIQVLYYVCPQVWAWNRGRIPKMAQIIDRLMVIFPFEVDVFKGVDLKVDFVGHPMVDELRAFRDSEPEPLPWNGEKKIALLPGSRKQEIHYILEPLLEAARLLEDSRPDLSFIVPVPERRLGLVEEILQKSKKAPRNLAVVAGQAREVLKQADAAFVASGTATLEAALLHCPTVLVYRGSWMNEMFVRMLIRIPWLGIANIVANKEIMPERLQRDMDPNKLAATIDPLMNDTPERAAMLENFQALEKLLGSGSPAKRVAQIIADSI
ncbi:lipid-A-disaccharide synthase [Tichowtungia aerotolerans]|uniref:Lipid-A-disaccharide synthase n=1 Tax=Tichowtungia aerotolerans TaxID=2697043 RepID=A0A6P1M5R9_9BACT|nr:lipid-A-disaccharide synthase [Tichowtungia aerotolerans]QHI67954.1 lipid-A-disaccharide synthase [Tichowtungia aerotolerans]